MHQALILLYILATQRIRLTTPHDYHVSLLGTRHFTREHVRTLCREHVRTLCSCTLSFVAMVVNFNGSSILLIFIAFATVEFTGGKPRSCFQRQYILDDFLSGSTFKDVTDIGINHEEEQLFVLQRSYPFVTIWKTDSTFLLEWDTLDLKYPHSLTMDASSDIFGTTVWITDMADHCIKQFTYTGNFIKSLGNCGPHTNGSGLNPLQFDRVTGLAQNSKGFMYATDGDIGGINNRIIVFDSHLRLIDVWNKNNKPGSGPLEFNLPHAIYVDWCDRVWITDTNNHRIQIISSNGTFLKEWK